MRKDKSDHSKSRPQGGQREGKAQRDGALQEGLHLAPNQPPQNSVLPPTDTGGGSGESGGGGGSSSEGGSGASGGE